MSDKDPLGAMIRELPPGERLGYITAEWGHAYINLYTETFRSAGLPKPQLLGKLVGTVSVILVIAALIAI